MGNVWDELFGRRIKALRVAKGWTQEQLAEHMTLAGHPMHQTTVAKLESATRPTNVGEVHALAAGLGVSPSQLFPLSDDAQLRFELAGCVNKLAAITAEKARLQRDISALNEEYAATEALHRKLAQQIKEAEAQQDSSTRGG